MHTLTDEQLNDLRDLATRLREPCSIVPEGAESAAYAEGIDHGRDSAADELEDWLSQFRT